MEITQVQIHVSEFANESLLGFCSVVFDDQFVVKDIRIVKLDSGRIFLAMPSRETTRRCQCGGVNVISAGFCCQCGRGLSPSRETLQDESDQAKVARPLQPIMDGRRERGGDGEPRRPERYRDIANPLTSQFRNHLEQVVLKHYWQCVAEGRQCVAEGQLDWAAKRDH